MNSKSRIFEFTSTDSGFIAFRSNLPEYGESQAFIIILKRNSLSLLINLAGIGTLGFTAMVNLLANGYIAGSLIALANERGMDYLQIFKLVLPHSIEFIGFWLTGGIGIGSGYYILNFIKTGHLPQKLVLGLFRLTLLSYLLILMAALCEVFLTFKNLR